MKQPETAYNGDSANIHAESTYDRWVREQEIPDIRGFSIEDLNEVRVVPWDRMGGLGAFIHLEGSEEELTDAYACEIPAGAQLKPQKHLYEETVFVVGGRGATAVWYEGEGERSGPGSQPPRGALPRSFRFTSCLRPPITSPSELA